MNSQLWELYNKRPNERALAKDEKAQLQKAMPAEVRPEDSALEEMKVTHPTFDLLAVELQPSLAALFHGAPFHTNRWGMRGKDYEMKPPPGTCRIALIGSSPELGSGVSDEQVWATILENHLNRENDRKKVAQYEILNFSVGGYSPLQRLTAFETKALSFDPDIVFYTAHPIDQVSLIGKLAQRVTDGTEIPYDYLRQVIHQAGIEGETNITAAKRALRPYSNDIMSWTYRHIVELCRQHSIVPVYIFLPNVVLKHAGPLPEQTRREIFAALVEAQDDGVDIPESRRVVAARFGMTEQQVVTFGAAEGGEPGARVYDFRVTGVAPHPRD